jgi:hypothetical protein
MITQGCSDDVVKNGGRDEMDEDQIVTRTKHDAICTLAPDRSSFGGSYRARTRVVIDRMRMLQMLMSSSGRPSARQILR